MTDEEKLAALEAERLAIQEKIKAYAVIKVLENKQQDIKDITFGKIWGHKWLQILLPSKLGTLKQSSTDDLIDSQVVTMYGNPPMELRLALAKVFRDFYGIKETQDDN